MCRHSEMMATAANGVTFFEASISEKQATSSKRQRRSPAPTAHAKGTEPPLLTSVSVVCRDARPQLQSLAHVGSAITAFLDFRSVAFACSIDSVALLQHIVAGYEKTPSTSVQRDPLFRQIHFSRGLKAACKAGHLSVVQWLALSPYFAACFMSTEAVRNAVQHGHLSILEWLHANRSDICWRRCFTAVDGNHLHVAKWLQPMTGRDENRGRMWIVPAAGAGNLEMVKWTYKLKGRTPAKSRVAVEAAAKNGHADVVQWLLEQKGPSAPQNADASGLLKEGNMETLEMLLVHRAKLNDETWVRGLPHAIASGHLDVILNGFSSAAIA